MIKPKAKGHTLKLKAKPKQPHPEAENQAPAGWRWYTSDLTACQNKAQHSSWKRNPDSLKHSLHKVPQRRKEFRLLTTLFTMSSL